MPIQSTHPEYDYMLPSVEKTKNAFRGDVHCYIPRLNGQSTQDYNTYVGRAAYYNVTERTACALIGAMNRKSYTLDGIAGDEEEPNILDDASFAEFLQQCELELLTSFRIAIIVDFDEETNTPYLCLYPNDCIINWCDTYVVIKGVQFMPDPKDPYSIKPVCYLYEHYLDEEGLYATRTWAQQPSATGAYGDMNSRTKFKVIAETQPAVRGKRLDYIPITVVSPYDTNIKTTGKPPLYTLACLNVEHFKVSVDIAHVAHFLAIPQPYLSGDLMSDQQTLRIGSDEIIQLKQGSTLEYLEFSGQGSKFLQDYQQKKEEQMFSLGSRLLQSKKGVESAEAMQLRVGAEGAALETIVSSLEAGLKEAFETYNTWYGKPGMEPTVELNRDFTPAPMPPEEMKALLELYVKGTITIETFLKRMYEGEVVDDPEQEKKDLDAQQKEKANEQVQAEEAEANAEAEVLTGDEPEQDQV